ncbi:angiotensin-converting enzyme 2-like, partial [Rhincodon typus]|uniref:angiotensin-converting enzyme 2-like n=1 Tax=Rhincodon typus TaxID=259920 RepID=UPI002030D0C8
NIASEAWSAFYQIASDEASKFPIDQIKKKQVKMQLKMLQDKGSGALPPKEYRQLMPRGVEMAGGGPRAAHFRTQKLSSLVGHCRGWCLVRLAMLDDQQAIGLTVLMAESKDYNKRLWAWEGWRVNVGKRLRPLYEEYAALKNKAAIMNGYEDYGDYWRGNYETDDVGVYAYSRNDLLKDVDRLLEEIMPLYKELHAYVRAKLRDTFGPEHISSTGCLPAHLLGKIIL